MGKVLQKKSVFNIQLNSLQISNEDPTLLRGKVIVHDFERSWNNQIITEEVCAENMNTLIGKRIVCKYIPAENNNGIDSLSNHVEGIGKDRNTGEDILITDTIPIGFFENAYIDNFTDEDGNTKRVLYGDIIIWNDDKYSNIAGLLLEWLSRGIKIHMSVEYLYRNYSVVDGVEYIQSPILYVAHALLNSEQRGDYAEVLPAYDSASLISLSERERWNKAVAQAIQQNQNSQNENVDINNSQKEVNDLADNMFKKVCELSFDDICSLLYGQLRSVLSDDEYDYSWITETYETYFILSYWNDDVHKYYKVTYTKSDEAVTIDWENRVEVVLYQEWREIPEVQTVFNELEQEKMKVADLTNQVNTLINEKENIEKQFNEATDKITALNAQVEEMKPLVEKYNNEQVEKAINEKKDYYLAKFKAVNAIDKFESEEVQNLIKLSINNNQEGKDAILSLNSMLVDLVNVKTEEKHEIREYSSKNENLIPTSKDFDSRYSE